MCACKVVVKSSQPYHLSKIRTDDLTSKFTFKDFLSKPKLFQQTFVHIKKQEGSVIRKDREERLLDFHIFLWIYICL